MTGKQLARFNLLLTNIVRDVAELEAMMKGIPGGFSEKERGMAFGMRYDADRLITEVAARLNAAAGEADP